MTVVSFTADLASEFAFEGGGIIRDAGTYGDIRYRSNGTGEWITVCVPVVSIPAGATINSATLNIYVDHAAMDEPDHNIRAELVADAVCPKAGDANNSLSGRTWTTATVNWLNANLGAPGFFDTPDISAVIQELVDTFGGINGHVLVSFDWAGGVGDLGVATPAYDPTYIATLTIDYTEGGAATTIPVTDSGAGNDIMGGVSVQFGMADNGAGDDTGSDISAQLGLADVASGGEVPNLSISVGLADFATAADAMPNILANIAIIESGLGISAQNISVNLYVPDAGSGGETVGTLAENIIAIIESAGGLENFGVSSQVSVTESGYAGSIIGISVGVQVGDSGMAVDIAAVFVNTILKALSDAGFGADVVLPPEILVGQTDNGVADDIIQSSIAVILDDSAIGNDVLSVPSIITGIAESASGAEVVLSNVHLNLSDGGSAIESVAAWLSVEGLGLYRVEIRFMRRIRIIPDKRVIKLSAKGRRVRIYQQL